VRCLYNRALGQCVFLIRMAQDDVVTKKKCGVASVSILISDFGFRISAGSLEWRNKVRHTESRLKTPFVIIPNMEFKKNCIFFNSTIITQSSKYNVRLRCK
jgi:hypothetical protein